MTDSSTHQPTEVQESLVERWDINQADDLDEELESSEEMSEVVCKRRRMCESRSKGRKMKIREENEQAAVKEAEMSSSLVR